MFNETPYKFHYMIRKFFHDFAYNLFNLQCYVSFVSVAVTAFPDKCDLREKGCIVAYSSRGDTSPSQPQGAQGRCLTLHHQFSNREQRRNGEQLSALQAYLSCHIPSSKAPLPRGSNLPKQHHPMKTQ